MKTLYTINGFFELLTTSSQYKRQSTEEKKLLLFDRCNWFITSIACINIQREQSLKEYVNLHSTFLKRYLTNRNYMDIQNCLAGLGIIIKNKPYSTSRFSKSFGLTDKAVKLGIEDIDIKTEKFRRQYNRINEERIREVLDNPLYKKIATNTAKLSVVEKQDFLVDAYFNPLYT